MADTFLRTINERDIEFQIPTDAQFLVLGRLLRVVEGISEDEGVATSTVHQLSKILDILDYMVVKDEDRNFLENQILTGEVDLTSLMDVFREVATEDPPPNRTARRSAAKKAPTRARKR